MSKKTISIIQNIIVDKASKKGIIIDRIILFGSRARGNDRRESDWDIAIVTNNKLEKSTFWDFYITVKRELTKNGIPTDIIIIPKSTFEKKKKIIGNVAYYANKEGKIIWKKSSKKSEDGLEKPMII